MFRTRQTHLLSPARRRDALYGGWDFVLEIDQREGDPLPAFGSSYSEELVDWGDGLPPVHYARSASSNAIGTVRSAPAMPSPGLHVVKVRLVHTATNANTRIVFGAANTSVSTPAYMPQLRRILKADFSGATRMDNFCLKCIRLAWAAPVSGTYRVRSLASAFQYCTSLQSLELGDLPACTSLASAFQACTSLQSLELGDLPRVQNILAMCRTCTKLERISIHAAGETIVTACTPFSGCRSLRRIDGPMRLSPDGPVANNSSHGFYSMFSGRDLLESMPDIWPRGGFTSAAAVSTNFSAMFNGCLNMRGTAPEWIWAGDAAHAPLTGNVKDMFQRCWMLDNYDDIPTTYTSSWRYR